VKMSSGKTTPMNNRAPKKANKTGKTSEGNIASSGKKSARGKKFEMSAGDFSKLSHRR